MPYHDLVIMSLLFVGSLLITAVIMPKIIKVVTYKQLMDSPIERSSHTKMIPSLGGVAFYIVLILGLYFIQYYDTNKLTISLIPGLLILFIVGIKDDLLVLSPLSKLGAQVLSISFVLGHPAFHFYDLHGFLGLNQLSQFISIPTSFFIMVTIVNAFNLIDGIDGLASIVAIIISGIYGVLFFMMDLFFFSGLSVILIGSLLAFLRFNLSSSRKIFMGDTGSLLIGFIIAIMTVRFFSVDTPQLTKIPFQIENLPLLIISILVVPLFDTARVFIIRILNRKWPFSPDRNHIHHILIDYSNLSHWKASFFIGIANVLFILIFLILGTVVNYFVLLIILFSLVVLLSYVFYRLKESFKVKESDHAIGNTEQSNF